MDVSIGIKLDIGFASEKSYRELFGTRNILEYLVELGFVSVETPVGPETDSEALAEHVNCCRDAGLEISLHPYSEHTGANPAFFSPVEDNAFRAFHQCFLSIAAEISSRQCSPLVVNIHSAAASADHPLTYDTAPWKEFIRLLIDSGYDKSIIIEVFPENFLAAGGIESLIQTAGAIRVIL